MSSSGRTPVFQPSALSHALPIILGYLPVGFAYGVLAVKAGLCLANAGLMSLIVYAGSAQLIGVEMIGSGAPALSVIATTLVVNLRHVLFSLAVSPHLKGWSRLRVALFATELTDETFSVHALRFNRQQQAPASTLAINAMVHVAWITGSLAGALAGGLVPDVRPLGLDFALPGMFAVLLAGQLGAKPQLVAALAGAGLALTPHPDRRCALRHPGGRGGCSGPGRGDPMDQTDILLTILGMALVTCLPRVLPALLFVGPHPARVVHPLAGPGAPGRARSPAGPVRAALWGPAPCGRGQSVHLGRGRDGALGLEDQGLLRAGAGRHGRGDPGALVPGLVSCHGLPPGIRLGPTPGGRAMSTLRPRPQMAPANLLKILALALVLVSGCGPDPVDRLQATRLDLDPSRTLRQALEGYRCFSRVVWSDYTDAQGRPVGSVTGILNLDCLTGQASQGRVFSAKDRAVLARAGANLCLKLEYTYGPDRPNGALSLMEARLVTMEWVRAAPQADWDLLAEIYAGQPGQAQARAAIDAADYCRSRPAPGSGQ